MSDLNDQLGEDLARLRAEGLDRAIRTVDSPQGPRVAMDGREFLNFSSNDYLGLANDPALRRAALEAIERYGVGAGASRLICGNLRPYVELERKLSAFKARESAIVFGSGYAANVGTITALVGKGDVVVLDKLDHASIIDGARLSGATLRVYPHRNVKRLEGILGSHRDRAGVRAAPAGDRRPRILIITETVFSMDGDVAPLSEIVALKEKYGAWLMIDEAHATGLWGANGRGWAEEAEVEDRVEVTLGTLSKALGAAGGYVCGSPTLIDHLRHRARSLVYSTALPPAVCAAAAAGVDLVMSEEGRVRRDRLRRNVGRLTAGLTAAGRQSESRGPIIPIIVGEERAAMELSRKLYDAGVFVPAIRYPTVPRGQARLRVTVTAAHSPEDIDRFLAVLSAVAPGHGSRKLIRER